MFKESRHVYLEPVAIVAEELRRLVALVADCTFLVAHVRVVRIGFFPRRSLAKLFVRAAMTFQALIHLRRLRGHLFNVALSALQPPLNVTVSQIVAG